MQKIIITVVLLLSMALFADEKIDENQKLLDEYQFFSSWKKYEKAISSLKKYLEKNPSALYEYQLGKLYLFSGTELDEAEQIYLNFIRDYDKLKGVERLSVSGAYWRLGMVYEKMGNLEKAKKSYEKGFSRCK
ncbi:MAG: tetratricopeptide repeat protein [Candidatus Cloacimonetes bacterium]|nr:tetratricopeptide repeat protein [Candidatus Cloacimonadota bacterium]